MKAIGAINHVLHNFSLVPIFLLPLHEKKQKKTFRFSLFFCQWTSELTAGLEWFRSMVLQLGLLREILNLAKGSCRDVNTQHFFIDSEYLYTTFWMNKF